MLDIPDREAIVQEFFVGVGRENVAIRADELTYPVQNPLEHRPRSDRRMLSAPCLFGGLAAEAIPAVL
jgi:hypothetical protein